MTVSLKNKICVGRNYYFFWVKNEASLGVGPTSKTNQISLNFHIQGVFNLPGRGFRQRITLTSSVPMTLNDVIVHVRQFVIALVSVDGCSSFLDPDGFCDVLDSSV